MSRRILDCVATRARRTPFETAIIDAREESITVWTWEKLWRESERVAALLLHLGVSPGEVVAYQLPNRNEFVAITLGILRVGAVCCPLLTIYREHELLYMLRCANARVMFAADEFRGRRHAAEVVALESRLPVLEHLIAVKASEKKTLLPEPQRLGCSRLYRAMAAAPLDVEAIEKRRPPQDALAQLLFTSGTSGRPKGVLHRQDVLTKAAALQAAHLGIDDGDRIFVPSPLGHQTGFLYGMWLALWVGVPQILQAVWNPERALRVLRECRGTFVQAAPTFLADMVQTVQSGVRAPSSLRIFVPTGAAVPRALALQAAHILHTKICGAYGTSEGGLATLAAPTDPVEKAAGSDGRALESIQIRICDEAGTTLPAGQEGYLQTRSPTMFEGYLNEPELTANAYTADGWYRTADLGRIDTDGYLYVTGRVNDIINRGGEKIPVSEIEQVLHHHASVREVAIVGMSDPRLGERACAFVVLRSGAHFDFDSMQAHLDACRVAKQYWPERLELVPGLPRTASGKIMKYVLRDWTRISADSQKPEPWRERI